VAESQGYWKAEGLDVQRTIFQTDAQNTQALIGGSVNVSQATIDVIILADTTAKTNDIKMIGGNVANPPYAVVTKADINSWKDLAGKQVSVTDLTGGSTVVLKKALAANGVDPKSVTMIASGGTSNRLAALKSGTVAFPLLAQPQSYEAQDSGYKILAHTPQFVPDFQFTGYNVSEKWASTHQQVLRSPLWPMPDRTYRPSPYAASILSPGAGVDARTPVRAWSRSRQRREDSCPTAPSASRRRLPGTPFPCGRRSSSKRSGPSGPQRIWRVRCVP